MYEIKYRNITAFIIVLNFCLLSHMQLSKFEFQGVQSDTSTPLAG